MSKILENSIWPNTNGQLGNIKTVMPDGINTLWPEGDALVDNFVYKDGKLVGLVDNKALVENESKSTVMPYDFVDITVNKRLETLMTFNVGERCKHLNVKYEIYLPKGYKRLEYLENTWRQYIDTGVKLSGESRVICEFSNVTSIDGMIFGARQDLGSNAFCATASTYWASYGNDYLHITDNVTEGKLDANKNKWTLNNYVRTFEEMSFETPVSALLFAMQTPNRIDDRYLRGRIYSFSISRAGVLQLNLIPCLDPTGAPCMYDIISQEPFYNEGAGQFLYPGAESQVVTSDLDEIFYAKKTAHGIQKLYHVPENFSGSKDEYAIENGFKQLVEPPMPASGYWSPEWTETDTQLICNWVEVDAPAEI